VSDSSDKALRALIDATEKLREDFFQNMRIIEFECGLKHDNDRKWYWEEWTKRFNEGQRMAKNQFRAIVEKLAEANDGSEFENLKFEARAALKEEKK